MNLISQCARRVVVIAAVMGASAGIFGIPDVAQAANYVYCPNDNALCFWANSNYNLPNYTTGRSTYVFDNTTFVGGIVGPNADSSWMNDGTQYVRIYNGTSYTLGATICLAPDGVAASNAAAENKGESNKWSASVPC